MQPVRSFDDQLTGKVARYEQVEIQGRAKCKAWDAPITQIHPHARRVDSKCQIRQRQTLKASDVGGLEIRR